MKWPLGSSIAVMTLLLSSAAYAADISTLAPADATQEASSSKAEQERIYPMGALTKISGRLRVDAKVEARGHSRSLTWELPRELSASQAFTDTRKKLQSEDGYVLFWCQGRDCGESSLWANEVFGNSRWLNGASDQQAVLLLRRAEPDDNTLIAVYSITGGNKRGYLHVEEFTAVAPLGDLLPTPGTVLRELRSTKELDYPTLDGEPDAVWAKLLADSLNRDGSLRVTLSGPQAEAWREALIARNVRGSRLEAETGSAKGLHLQLIR